MTPGAWREARVELVDGYSLLGRDGGPTSTVDDARVAIEGGFLHVDVGGTGTIQIVSAPAVRRVSYLAG